MFPENLISMADLSIPAMEEIFRRAAYYKEKDNGTPFSALKGKYIALSFWEPSTRTRLSFELAVQKLGGRILDLRPGQNSEKKGESLEDTISTLQAMGADALIFRHSLPGLFGRIGQKIKIPLLSGGEGCYQHPTQALLDIFTLQEAGVVLRGVEIVMIGDIVHSRVARSHLLVLPALGARVTLVGPPALLPAELVPSGVDYSYRLDEPLTRAEVLYLLRVQTERHRGLFTTPGEYASLYGLHEKRLPLLTQKPYIMHPGPVNMGVELSPGGLQMLESTCPEKILIQRQVANGVYVRMAVLDLLVSKG